jgi:hypothetical protein
MSNLSRPSLKLLLALFLTFLLLSIADLYLTWRLVSQGDGRLLESNPVASYWLSNYGWSGMIAFKLGMVVLIGTLAGLIAWRRPRTSELMMTFACGAQSAVAVYSIFLASTLGDSSANISPEVLWPGRVRPPGAGKDVPYYPIGALPVNGPFLLLTHKAVQEELELTNAQVNAVTELVDKRDEIRQSTRSTTPKEWNDRAQQLLAAEKTVLDDLELEQSDRLQEIALQHRGPFALSDPAVAQALDLSDKQKERVRTLIDEAGRWRFMPGRGRGRFPDAGRKSDEDLARSKKELLAVLTTDQTAKWKEMIGEPFRVDLLPKLEKPPSPGREFRRPPPR